MSSDLPTEDIQRRLREFARTRDWQRFHTPKNLAMALAGEAGELLELLQWLTPEESLGLSDDQASQSRVAEELADVVIYALRMADVLGVDLAAAISTKIDLNETRYPVEYAKGNARKYTDLSDEAKT
jgi:NTP pyrophosphatase (non-canonical NTP hydrolase)